MSYVYLGLAIACEVIATLALNASDRMTRLGPTAVVIIGYGGAFYFLSQTLQLIPVAVAYAIWSAAGVCLIAIGAWLFQRQPLDPAAIAGICLIVAGVGVIQIFSETRAH